VLRIVESWDGWLAAVWEGRGGMGKKKKEKQRKRVSTEGVYIMVFTDGIHRRIHSVGDSIGDSVGDSIGDSAMSLYGYLSLNPSVIPSVKSSEKTPRHHVVAPFQTTCIVRRRYGRYIPTDIFHLYIPTVSPTELVHRYIPTDFEMEFSPSVITTNEIFPSVIPLVFSGFLVVYKLSHYYQLILLIY